MPEYMKPGFRGNPRLKSKGSKIEWTQELVDEYIKCRDDVYYFIETYYQIVTEKGLVKMKLRSYQREIIESMRDNRFTLMVQSRQSGKTEVMRAFLLWYVLFQEFKTVAVVANKEAMANEILTKLQLSYQHLPLWLQHSVLEFNKGSFVLENQSRIFASATSKDALRGFTVNLIFVDEAAHIEHWEEFFSAIQPTIAAGAETKLIMASTPNGLNHFYEFWEGSSKRKNTNGFISFFVPWWEVPGRDEAWMKETLAAMNFNQQKFDQEYSCSFHGTSGTLLSGWILKVLKEEVREPLTIYDDSLRIYEHPVKASKEWVIENGHPVEKSKPEHRYVITCDVSRGKTLDYSAFHVIDVTETPYKQVCTFRSNKITPRDYGEIIYRVAKSYNQAYVLVEINDLGEQVSDILIYEYEYENVLCTESAGRAGKRITLVIREGKVDKGIRTTQVTKNAGCYLLKLITEQKKLLLPDSDTVNELNTFSKVRNTYQAEEGKHDDLAMGLVLFGWLTEQSFFKDMTEIKTINEIRDKTSDDIHQALLSFGFNTTENAPARIFEFPNEVNMNNQFRAGYLYPYYDHYETSKNAKVVPNF